MRHVDPAVVKETIRKGAWNEEAFINLFEGTQTHQIGRDVCLTTAFIVAESDTRDSSKEM